MYESISKNNELENEMSLDMSYFWYSDDLMYEKCRSSGYHSNSLLSGQVGHVQNDYVKTVPTTM